MALKIIVHDSVTQAEKHAKAWFVTMRRKQMMNPSVDNVELHGVAQHLVRYPVICDDCGLTYWANSPWAEHPKCQKARDKVGF